MKNDLIDWLSLHINDKYKDELIFDKILEIYDIILTYINKNNLKLKTENKLFLLRLVLLLYENSKVN